MTRVLSCMLVQLIANDCASSGCWPYLGKVQGFSEIPTLFKVFSQRVRCRIKLIKLIPEANCNQLVSSKSV